MTRAKRLMLTAVVVNLGVLFGGCSELGIPDTRLWSAELNKRRCHELDEQVCLTTQGCELVYSACGMCAPDGQCPPCEAARCQAAPTPNQPPPRGSCESLDEAACSARSDCYGEYWACPAVCIDDGNGGCVPCEAPPFQCRTVNPPPPPTGSCEGLDEVACNARSDCYGEYWACPDVCISDGNGGCIPCDAPPFQCRSVNVPPASQCDGLSERACNQTSGCLGIYSGQCPPCAPNENCRQCDPEGFAFSHCTLDRSTCEVPPNPRDGGEPSYDAGWWNGGGGYDAGSWNGGGGYDAGSWNGGGAYDAGSPNWGGRDGGW